MATHDSFQPTATIETLRRRAALLARVRTFFDERGFFEVQTPLLSRESIIDRYLDPISVDLNLFGECQKFYLQTSPEFGMKRLLAAGAKAIYQIAQAFRGGEAGSRHNPEFTMLEWYRVGDSYQQGMQFLSDFGQSIMQSPPAEIITYRDAFGRFAKVDPFVAGVSQLATLLPGEPTPSDGFDRDHLLNSILADLVEPNLGKTRPTIVCDWPVTQAALAKVRAGEPSVAERYELFVNGVELANGYHELTDAEELAHRMKTAQTQRVAVGAEPLPSPTRLLRAMRSGIPDCCGVAVGLDRLMMVIEGRGTIGDVIAFPIDRA